MNPMQQQNPHEFLKWIPVSPGQNEKHIGIAVIRFERRFIFRFKILPSDQGGYWATTGSVKTGVVNGKDKYDNCFELDSSYENDAMREFVIENVMALLMQRPNPVASPSVFTPPQSYQSAPAVPQPQQQSFNYGQQPAQNAQTWPQAQQNQQAMQGQGYSNQPTRMDETIPF